MRASFNELGRPNADVAMGVDTRQELDLRVGPQTCSISCGVLRKGDAKHPGFYRRCNMVDRFEQRIHLTCQVGIE